MAFHGSIAAHEDSLSAGAQRGATGAADIKRWALPEAGARLTFVDGVYVPELSFNHAGVTVENMAAGLTRHDAAMQTQLGRHAAFDANAFAALNTAFLSDGALIVVPRTSQ